MMKKAKEEVVKGSWYIITFSFIIIDNDVIVVMTLITGGHLTI